MLVILVGPDNYSLIEWLKPTEVSLNSLEPQSRVTFLSTSCYLWQTNTEGRTRDHAFNRIICLVFKQTRRTRKENLYGLNGVFTHKHKHINSVHLTQQTTKTMFDYKMIKNRWKNNLHVIWSKQQLHSLSLRLLLKLQEHSYVSLDKARRVSKLPVGLTTRPGKSSIPMVVHTFPAPASQAFVPNFSGMLTGVCEDTAVFSVQLLLQM